ncbi:MAG: DUF4145 domain-containing protein [Isosphaera sp.]|nr:DUF4145 domain-containing protein [Isosphaera sp.]
MSDVELAVTRAKALEALLAQAGAAGKGLHEKVTSAEGRLPPPLVKKLRFVATVRNKIVHEADYQRIDDRAGFVRACDEAEAELRALLAPAGGSLRRWVLVLAAVAVVLLAVLVWRLV